MKISRRFGKSSYYKMNFVLFNWDQWTVL